jgi:hypothetical protein
MLVLTPNSAKGRAWADRALARNPLGGGGDRRPAQHGEAAYRRPTEITTVLRNVSDSLRTSRHLSVPTSVAQVIPIFRGWVPQRRNLHADRAQKST